MKHAQKSFPRKDRISEQIRRDLSLLIAQEMKDPRLSMVSITAVELTPDYAHAKVFYSTFLETPPKDIEAAFQKAAGFLRKELGKGLRIHTLPELHFVPDHTLADAAVLSKKIEEAIAVTAQSLA